MLNGLWHTHFVAGPAHGDGMAVLRDGEILGGEPTYTYTGSYRLDGAFLYANVRVSPYPAGGPSDASEGPLTFVLRGSVVGDAGSLSGLRSQSRRQGSPNVLSYVDCHINCGC